MLTQGNLLQKEKAKLLREKQQQIGREKALEMEPLHLAGCMLYWAEGTKAINAFQFTNCNPNMHRIILAFIKKFFPQFVCRLRFRISFYPSSDNTYDSVRQYWCQELGVEASSFTKPTDKSKYYSKPKTNKYKNGVLYIQVGATEMLQHITGAIEIYQKMVAAGWSRTNGGLLMRQT